jgi:transposase
MNTVLVIMDIGLNMKPKRHQYSKIFRAIYNFLGFVYSEILINEDFIHIFLRRTKKTAICPECGRRNKLSDNWYQRTIRDLDMGEIQCFVTFDENKMNCKCGFRGIEKLEFVRPYARCTIRFEKFVAFLCQKMTLKDVCEITGIDWKTAKRIDKYYIKQQMVDLKHITPRRIGIDEIAYDKGHKYLTIVRDLELNGIIWIGLDRKQATLDWFFYELGIFKSNQIEVAVVDMWDPYIASLKKHCPNVQIIIDKFHLIKKVNEALDEVRKDEFAKASDRERFYMKKKRFMILKREKNLIEKQKEDLKELMDKNETLYSAYLLKEQISDILDEDNVTKALDRLSHWTKNVYDSGINSMIKINKTIKKYYYGIMNYFKHKFTNAQSEGFNNKINIVKRKAYGYWDLEYFILKIFQACGVMSM